MKMPPDNCIAALDQAVSETLEAMAFFEVAPMAEAAAEPKTETWVSGEVEILEPWEGRLKLLFPAVQAESICRLVRGREEEQVKRQNILDTVGELANTVAGRCLAALVPPDKSFRIGAPKTSPEQSNPASSISRNYVNIDQEPVLRATLALNPILDQAE